MSEFAGFPLEGLDFLGALGTKDKTWFDANRKTYEKHVVAPAKAFVSSLGSILQHEISRGIEAQPKTNGSIAPINNDLRFSPNAAPYKDHLMFRFWEGPVKKTSAMLMVRVHPTEGVGFATGMNFENLDQWRTSVSDEATGAPLVHAIDTLVKTTGAEIVGGGALKNVPKPYAADHVRGDLLRHKGLQVRFIQKTPKVITKPGFVEWCAGQLSYSADVHHWLVENMIQQSMVR